MDKNKLLIPASILFSAIIIAGAWIYTAGQKYSYEKQSADISSKVQTQASDEKLEKMVLPQEVELPVSWNDLGIKMIETGVIDAQKFEAIYTERGGLNDEMKQMLYSKNNGKIKISLENQAYILNLLWALGLGNRNDILTKGPMTDAKYGGAGNFASTGGWSLSAGDSMNHYSKHQFIVLSKEQQEKIERVSRGIYRPCCGNSVYFPDCNHGMAMLGFLELMASQGANEEEMYKSALLLNSYWFPDTYITIAKFLDSKGISWSETNPKEILGADYSSGQGFKNIKNQVAPVQNKSGGGCGV